MPNGQGGRQQVLRGIVEHDRMTTEMEALVVAVAAVALLGGVACLFAPQEMGTGYAALLAAWAMCAILAAFDLRWSALVATVVTVAGFAVWRTWSLGQGLDGIWWGDYLLLLAVPVGAALTNALARIARSDSVVAISMGRRLSELVLVDELTGMYNMRALYTDLERSMAYARRDEDSPLSLLCVELRYGEELRHMLSTDEYDRLVREVATRLSHLVRIEDRTYCVDPAGSFAISLTTDEPGMAVVADRMRSKLEQSSRFATSNGDEVRVDLRIAGKQYDGNGETSAQTFYSEAHAELEFDV